MCRRYLKPVWATTRLDSIASLDLEFPINQVGPLYIRRREQGLETLRPRSPAPPHPPLFRTPPPDQSLVTRWRVQVILAAFEIRLRCCPCRSLGKRGPFVGARSQGAFIPAPEMTHEIVQAKMRFLCTTPDISDGSPSYNLAESTATQKSGQRSYNPFSRIIKISQSCRMSLFHACT